MMPSPTDQSPALLRPDFGFCLALVCLLSTGCAVLSSPLEISSAPTAETPSSPPPAVELPPPVLQIETSSGAVVLSWDAPHAIQLYRRNVLSDDAPVLLTSLLSRSQTFRDHGAVPGDVYAYKARFLPLGSSQTAPGPFSDEIYILVNEEPPDVEPTIRP